MAPHYPRVSDTCSPFKARPKIITIEPRRPRPAKQDQSVLVPLVSVAFALLVMVAVALPLGRAITFTASLF